MGLKPKTIYQTISMEFPSEIVDDGEIRLSFALDVKNEDAIGLSGGGVWKGVEMIGSFDGFVGFAHNVTGEDKPAVDALLHDLSEALTEEYNVPPVEEPTPEEEEGSGSGDGEGSGSGSSEGSGSGDGEGNQQEGE